MRCLLCAGDLQARAIAGVRPASVTSDSRLCPLPARIWACVRCGHLQKAPDAAERAAIQALYADYRAHHLSGGREQLTFTPGAPPRARSEHALAQLRGVLPPRGRLLDVGTGAGAVLASAAAVLPQWDLYAFDVAERHRAAIEARPHVRGFFSGDLAAVPDLPFDLIVLWHVLEHLDEPAGVLRDLRGRLGACGRLLIQVPDLERNPYDLAVIDHASHFTRRHLDALVRAAGFRIALDGRDWSHNCLTVLLEPAAAQPGPPLPEPSHGPSPVEWLTAAVKDFESRGGRGEYGIFGTGMAGIWLAGQLSRSPACFVDEDEARWGQMVAGVTVTGPAAVPAGLPLLMAFDAPTGQVIAARLRREYPSLASSPLIVSPEPAA